MQGRKMALGVVEVGVGCAAADSSAPCMPPLLQEPRRHGAGSGRAPHAAAARVWQCQPGGAPGVMAWPASTAWRAPFSAPHLLGALSASVSLLPSLCSCSPNLTLSKLSLFTRPVLFSLVPAPPVLFACNKQLSLTDLRPASSRCARRQRRRGCGRGCPLLLLLGLS